MKNPENKPLRIVRKPHEDVPRLLPRNEALILSNLAIAEATLVRAGKDSAMPHFIAIVKRIEDLLGIEFEIMEQE